uniref:Uncharacterized protein n=1 Tax=Meloidogyne enterolobii TaxID=390850 RepID=A0A6V7Y1N7_MELEN|nr:unnamed protein product [Meloidogyne enterolobii]
MLLLIFLMEVQQILENCNGKDWGNSTKVEENSGLNLSLQSSTNSNSQSSTTTNNKTLNIQNAKNNNNSMMLSVKEEPISSSSTALVTATSSSSTISPSSLARVFHEGKPNAATVTLSCHQPTDPYYIFIRSLLASTGSGQNSTLAVSIRIINRALMFRNNFMGRGTRRI